MKANQSENITSYKIRTLFGKETGEKEEHEKSGSFTFEADHRKITVHLDLDIMLMKMDDGILVVLKNLETELPLECSRCLKKIQRPLHIESTEREFFFKKANAEEVEDEMDVYLADIKLMKLDICEMLRQEILLHFPAFPVCSETCKGLCSVCGANLNKETCEHQKKQKKVEEEPKRVKPFENLKNLFR